MARNKQLADDEMALEFYKVPRSQFKKSLENAVRFSMSGGFKKEPDITLYLTSEDQKILSPLLPVLNNALVEYTEGNTSKVWGMHTMLDESLSGYNRGIDTLMIKADEIAEWHKHYIDSCDMIKERGYLNSSDIKNLEQEIDSESHKPDYRTHKELIKNKEDMKKDISAFNIMDALKLRKIFLQKYDIVNHECNWILDNYPNVP